MSCGCSDKKAQTATAPRLLHVDALDGPDQGPETAGAARLLDLSTPVFEPDPDSYAAFSEQDAGGIVVSAPAPSLAAALLALAQRWA